MPGKNEAVIGKLLRSVFHALRDRLAILRLRQEVNRLRLAHYDRLVDSVRGLRRVIETQKRAIEDLHRQLEARDASIEKLRAEYAALQARRGESRSDIIRAERLAVFRRMQEVVTQLPTLRAAVEEGADLSARDVLGLLAPLEQVWRDLGFEVIGEAGQIVPYDPKLHRPVGREARSVNPDDAVRVRYVGYTYNGEIVCKAEVTRVEQEERVS